MRRSLPLLLVLAGLVAAPGAHAASLQSIGGFNAPTYVTTPPGDASRLFVVERAGRIQVIRNGRRQTFLDISSRVESSAGETGLLSMAFAPDYASSRRFYVYYARSNGSGATCGDTNTCPPIVIEEYKRLRRNSLRADSGSARRVLAIAHPNASNHYGGQLQAGPDGRLWFATGDGGGGEAANAQSLGSPLGKVMRINPRGSGPDRFGIPSGNPFRSLPGAQDPIWSFGLRNPYRFSFDRLTGDLLLSDVGQADREEVNFAAASGRGRGANYQWARCEGTLSFPGGGACGFGGTRPVLERPHGGAVCSITGGYVARDSSLGGLTGRYLYGDLCDPSIRSARLSPGGSSGDGPTGMTTNQLVSFGEDACGRLYTAELGGRVARVVNGASSCRRADPLRPRLSLGGARRQRPLARRRVSVRVRCNEPCRARSVARLSLRVGGRRVQSRTILRGPLPLGSTSTLRLGLSRGAAAAIRGALRGGQVVRARITVRVRDAAGNPRTRTRLIRLLG